MMDCQIEGNVLRVKIDEGQYNESVLYKCMYWFSGDFDVVIDSVRRPFLEVTLRRKSNAESPDWTTVIERIRASLIDFKLRDIISLETKAIRELLVAIAFVYYDIGDSQELEISDL